MKKIVLSLSFGLLANNIVATLVAIFILNPLLNPMFNGTVRSHEAGLEMPSLLSGYFLLTLFMIVGYNYFSLDVNWLKKGFLWGLLSGGAVFLSGHLIVAGWSVIPPVPMLISGMLDILAPITTGIVIAYVYRNE